MAQVAVEIPLVFCGVHQTEEVSFYCKDCQLLVCSDCVVGQHSGHTFQKITDIVEEKRQNIDTYLDKIEQEYIPELKDKIKKARKTKTRHSRNGNNTVSEINEKADFLISAIDKARNECIQEFKAALLRDEKKLDKFEHKVNELLARAEEIVNSCRSEMETCNDVRIVQLQMELSRKTEKIRQLGLKDIPQVQQLVFLTSEQDQGTIKGLIGCVMDREEIETSSDMAQSQPLGRVAETKLEAVSSFQHETDKGEIRAIVALEDKSAWIATYQGTEIKHVKKNGKVDKTLSFCTTIGDIAITEDESLLVTPTGGIDGHQYQIKKVTPDGDTVTFVDVKPLIPFCVCVSQTGHVYVGCVDDYNFDVIENNIRCVMKLANTGIVQQKYQHNDNGQALFTMPQKLQENVNGDIWVRDRTGKSSGRIVVLRQDRAVRCVYTGAQNSRITETFNPGDITAAGDGTMLVTDINNHIIHVIDDNGYLLYFIGSENTTRIYAPSAICLNRKKNLLWVGNFKGKIHILRLK